MSKQETNSDVADRRMMVFEKYPALEDLYVNDTTVHTYIDAFALGGITLDQVVQAIIITLAGSKESYFKMAVGEAL